MRGSILVLLYCSLINAKTITTNPCPAEPPEHRSCSSCATTGGPLCNKSRKKLYYFRYNSVFSASSFFCLLDSGIQPLRSLSLPYALDVFLTAWKRSIFHAGFYLKMVKFSRMVHWPFLTASYPISALEVKHEKNSPTQ